MRHEALDKEGWIGSCYLVQNVLHLHRRRVDGVVPVERETYAREKETRVK
jgi:hypothetical protein